MILLSPEKSAPKAMIFVHVQYVCRIQNMGDPLFDFSDVKIERVMFSEDLMEGAKAFVLVDTAILSSQIFRSIMHSFCWFT